MDLELAGRTVLVTGGSDGLGRALCHRLVSEGASTAFCGRDPDRVDSARVALAAAGGQFLGVVADVTKPAELSRFVEASLERFGRIDGLVNNAGASAARPLLQTTDADFEADLDLKLHAAVRLCRLTLAHLAKERGAIVNVLAIGAKTPGAASLPSSVSRAAGMALTKALSKDAGPSGVRVNAVLIGLVESGQWERLAASTATPIDEFYRSMAEDSAIPLGRVGRAAEFADLVSFLLSPRAGYVSGTAINLDGGLCATV